MKKCSFAVCLFASLTSCGCGKSGDPDSATVLEVKAVSGEISLDNDIFTKDSPINIRLTLSNPFDTKMKLYNNIHDGLFDYRMDLFKIKFATGHVQDRDYPRDYKYASGGSPRLEQHNTCSELIDLRKIFTFDEEGQYEAELTYLILYMPWDGVSPVIKKKDEYKILTIRKNVIFTIVKVLDS